MNFAIKSAWIIKEYLFTAMFLKVLLVIFLQQWNKNGNLRTSEYHKADHYLRFCSGRTLKTANYFI